jgi:hypothetical protein
LESIFNVKHLSGSKDLKNTSNKNNNHKSIKVAFDNNNNKKQYLYTKSYRPQKQPSSFIGRHSLTELRVTCATAGERGKLTCQPRDLIPIHPNQAQMVQTIVLKWVIQKG